MTTFAADEYAEIKTRLEEIEKQRLAIATYTCDKCSGTGWIISVAMKEVVCYTCGNPLNKPKPEIAF